MPTGIEASRSLRDALLVLGASGEPGRRMIWSSLFHLHRDGLLPKGLRTIGATADGHGWYA